LLAGDPRSSVRLERILRVIIGAKRLKLADQSHIVILVVDRTSF
jgi:hypothetical protein